MTRMDDNLQRRTIALADDLDRKANLAAEVHADLCGHGLWGTGVTQGVERKLSELADAYRDLVRLSHVDEKNLMDGVEVTDDQRREIEAQVARYGDDDTPCVGLDSHKVVPASEWEWDDKGHYPEGAVAVKFNYIGERESADEQEHHGLEVTVFDREGKVVDSQDFG